MRLLSGLAVMAMVFGNVSLFATDMESTNVSELIDNLKIDVAAAEDIPEAKPAPAPFHPGGPGGHVDGGHQDHHDGPVGPGGGHIDGNHHDGPVGPGGFDGHHDIPGGGHADGNHHNEPVWPQHPGNPGWHPVHPVNPFPDPSPVYTESTVSFNRVYTNYDGSVWVSLSDSNPPSGNMKLRFSLFSTDGSDKSYVVDATLEGSYSYDVKVMEHSVPGAYSLMIDTYANGEYHSIDAGMVTVE